MVITIRFGGFGSKSRGFGVFVGNEGKTLDLLTCWGSYRVDYRDQFSFPLSLYNTSI